MLIFHHILCSFLVFFLEYNFVSNQECYRQSNRTEEEIIKYYAKGVIPIEEKILEFYNEINGNYRQFCVIKEEGDDFFQKSGVFIGRSVDLGNLDFQTINKWNLGKNITNKLKNFIKLFGDDAEKSLSNISDTEFLNEAEIERINECYYKYITDHINKSVFKSNSSLFGAIALYAKYNKHLPIEISQAINEGNFDEAGDAIQNTQGKYYYKKVISNLFFNEGIKKKFNAHMFIIFDPSIIHSTQFPNFKNCIINFTFSFPDNIFSFWYSNPSDNQELNAEKAREFISNFSIIEPLPTFNYKEITSAIYNKFKFQRYYNNTYTQRILFILLSNINVNYNGSIDFNVIEEENNGFIPIILGNITKDLSLNILYNITTKKEGIIPFNESTILDSNDYLHIINSAIVTSVETFIFYDSNLNILSIDNIMSTSNDLIQYFYINKYTQNEAVNEPMTYHVELIPYSKSNFTIFISDETPYPDIFNKSISHFGLGVDNPYINFNTNRQNFSIGINSNEMHYKITVQLCKKNCEIESNGILPSNKVNINMTRYSYHSFENCEILTCPLDYRRLFVQYIDGVEEYFDKDVYECLYPKYSCVYLKEENGYINENNVYIGYNLKINDYSYLDLRKEKIPLYLIHLLFPFLKTNSISTNYKEIIERYNLKINKEQIRLLLNITIKKHKENIDRLAMKCQNHFESSELFAIIMYSIDNQQNFKENQICSFQIDRGSFYSSLFTGDNLPELVLKQKGIQMMLMETIEPFDSLALMINCLIVREVDLYNRYIRNFIDNLKDSYSLMLFSYDKKMKFLFNSNNQENLDEIFKKYINSNKKENIISQQMDIRDALKYFIRFFAHYDYGSKKTIIFLANYNQTEEHPEEILKDIDNEEVNKIKSMGINIIILTNNKVNFNKMEDKYNGYKYIYFKSFDNYNKGLDLKLKKATEDLPIEINRDKNIIINLEEGQNVTYYFNFNMTQIDMFKFSANSKNIQVYFSDIFPKPNEYIFNNKSQSNMNRSRYKFSYALNSNISTFSMTIKAKENLNYYKVYVTKCNNKKCKNEITQLIVFITFIFGGFVILLYGIWNCYSDLNVKKKINISNIFQEFK